MSQPIARSDHGQDVVEHWCTKRRYPSSEIAAKVVEKLQAKGREESRYYRCPDCDGWHTARSGNTRRAA